MPKLDVSKPGVIAFITERCENESRLRMQWVQRNSKNIKKYASLKPDAKNYSETDITKATLVTGMATITRDHKESMCHRLRAPVPDYVNAKTDSTTPVPIMMPVNDEVKTILLESRKEYLNVRAKTAPEDKYWLLETSNWKYGWKLNENEFKVRGPAYGKVNHTANNLKNRVGPQPDPQYYSSPYTYSHFCFQ